MSFDFPPASSPSPVHQQAFRHPSSSHDSTSIPFPNSHPSALSSNHSSLLACAARDAWSGSSNLHAPTDRSQSVAPRRLDNSRRIAPRSRQSERSRHGSRPHGALLRLRQVNNSVLELPLSCEAEHFELRPNTSASHIGSPTLTHVAMAHQSTRRALPEDADSPDRSAKRAKLDGDDDGSQSRPLRYGYEGHARPTKLRMEVVYSDSEDAEKCLVDDGSVFCSFKTCGNLIFRHCDDTVADISKIVIKAPGSDWMAPYARFVASSLIC